MYISIFRNVAVLSKDIGTIQTRTSDAHKLQHPVGRLIKTLFSHFSYGIYHGFVVIYHNLQATTTPSRFGLDLVQIHLPVNAGERESGWRLVGGRADDLPSPAV